VNKVEREMVLSYVMSSSTKVDLALKICEVHGNIANTILHQFKNTLKAKLETRLLGERSSGWRVTDTFKEDCIKQKWPTIRIERDCWNNHYAIQLQGYSAGFRDVYYGVRMRFEEVSKSYDKVEAERCSKRIADAAKEAGIASCKPSHTWPCSAHPNDEYRYWLRHRTLSRLHDDSGEIADYFTNELMRVADALRELIDSFGDDRQ
jgi:hypothetical protein